MAKVLGSLRVDTPHNGNTVSLLSKGVTFYKPYFFNIAFFPL